MKMISIHLFRMKPPNVAQCMLVHPAQPCLPCRDCHGIGPSLSHAPRLCLSLRQSALVYGLEIPATRKIVNFSLTKAPFSRLFGLAVIMAHNGPALPCGVTQSRHVKTNSDALHPPMYRDCVHTCVSRCLLFPVRLEFNGSSNEEAKRGCVAIDR